MGMPDVDVMAFGAHPDDIELGCGGTLIKLVEMGHSIVLVDVTCAELGTRGTVETRQAEAAQAAQTIGAVARENLALQDGDIRVDRESKRKVAAVIRKYRPRLVLAPYYRDRHPDHYHASELVYEGTFLAGLTRYETGQESYRPSQVIYYMGWYEFEPTFIVDISAQFELKMQAIYAYSTQFKPDDPSYTQTRLTSPAYHWMLVHRMAYYGSLIGKQYGEGFLIRGMMEVENPLNLWFASF
jgi:bacillithiol biosynthesis deacetylase BshB1